jgi:hypothetical protein
VVESVPVTAFVFTCEPPLAADGELVHAAARNIGTTANTHESFFIGTLLIQSPPPGAARVAHRDGRVL